MTVSTPPTSPSGRLAGACGLASAAFVLVAPTLAGPVGEALWTLGFVVLVPFLAGLAARVRAAAGPASMLAYTVLAGGASYVSVQLAANGAGYVASHIAESSPVHGPLHEVNSALFVVGLLPLGIAVAAVAAGALRHGALPRWLGWCAAVLAPVLLVNGAALGTDQMWGLLGFQLWTLAAGVTLLRARQRHTQFAPPMPETVASH